MRWSISLIPDESQDAALIVVSEAQKHFPFDPFQILTRRLAVHEAVLNALKYGGGEVKLNASGKGERMTVEIRQKNAVILPEKTPAHCGTALIRRYAREVRFSEDGCALIVLFY